MATPRNRGEAKRKARRQKVLNLRIQGLTQYEIAKKLNMHQPDVSKDLKLAWEVWAEEVRQEQIHFCNLDMLRIEKLIQAKWEHAMSGDVKSANFILNALSRRAQLLGLDKQQTYIQTDASLEEMQDKLERILQGEKIVEEHNPPSPEEQ